MKFYRAMRMAATSVLALVAGATAGSVWSAEVVVGEVHPTTGPVAFYGAPMSNAIILAVDEINAAGGIKAGGQTYTIKLLSGDTQGNPTVGVAALKKLISDGARYIIGPLSSGVAPALKPIIEANNQLTQLIDGTVAEGIVNGVNIFRHQATVDVGYQYPLEALVKARKYPTVALMTDRFHSGAMNSEAGVVARLNQQGNKVVGQEYHKSKDTDFSAQLTKVKSLNPAAVILRGFPNENTLITKQARQLGFAGQIIWQGQAPPATVLKNISAADMEGVLNAYPLTNEDYIKMGNENAKRMANAYRKKFNAEPGELSALSYGAVYILAAAMKKAGSIDNAAVNKALAALKISDVPELIDIYQPYPGGMLFDGKGQAALPGLPVIWHNSGWEPLRP